MKEIHISHFVTSSAKTMQAMFRGCLTITELDITNFDIICEIIFLQINYF